MNAWHFGIFIFCFLCAQNEHMQGWSCLYIHLHVWSLKLLSHSVRFLLGMSTLKVVKQIILCSCQSSVSLLYVKLV